MHPTTLVVTTKKQGEPWIRFMSRREAVRYTQLRADELAGNIQHLTLQVRMPLLVSGRTGALAVKVTLIGHYVADFFYSEPEPGRESWRPVYEDCKGFRTEMYRWKKKHFEAQYGLAIRET